MNNECLKRAYKAPALQPINLYNSEMIAACGWSKEDLAEPGQECDDKVFNITYPEGCTYSAVLGS